MIVLVAGCMVAGCAGCAETTKRRAAQPAADSHTPVQDGGLRVSTIEPLVLGDAFTIDSKILGERRRIHVFMPTAYGQKFEQPLPVLYMPDGGLDEDFLHIAGLVQVLVSNGGIRPLLLVGIPNTQRRRDLTGPTSNPEDLKIAPVVGGSAAFRRFIREELRPEVSARYRTTDEAAIIGESLAGLFVVETFFLEPDLFSTYIAIDPSLWWNNEEILRTAEARLRSAPQGTRSVFLAQSHEPEMLKLTDALASMLTAHRPEGLTFHYAPMTGEAHSTIYHPAALIAMRTVLGHETR